MLNVDEDVRKEKYLSNKTVIVVKNVFAFDKLKVLICLQ